MQDFIDKHEKHILGTLSGFDRVRFRGTFRVLAVARLLLTWLNHQSVLIKDFGAFAESLTQRLQAAVEQVARECLRARGLLDERSRRPAVGYFSRKHDSQRLQYRENRLKIQRTWNS